jgi:hypothetical protein
MKTTIILISVCYLLIPFTGFGQQAQSHEEEAIAMVSQIYDQVSGTGEEAVDWEQIRSIFVDEAVVVLRTSREATSQFTVEEFIQDFRNFYNSPRLGDAGFKEEVLQLEAEVYYDMAFVAVLYASSILDSDAPPQKGIDFWLLTLKEDSWKVVSVTNEFVRPGEALPAIFEEN